MTSDCGELSPLLLNHMWSLLPTSRHHSWVCSSGSRGYCSFKEMLQGGVPGTTVFIESHNLCNADENIPAYFSLVHTNAADEVPTIPTTVSCLTIYTNTKLPRSFITECYYLKALDLSPLANMTVFPDDFLMSCDALTTLDLSPLVNLKKLPPFFLSGTGLTTLDLSPLCAPHEATMGLPG